MHLCHKWMNSSCTWWHVPTSDQWPYFMRVGHTCGYIVCSLQANLHQPYKPLLLLRPTCTWPHLNWLWDAKFNQHDHTHSQMGLELQRGKAAWEFGSLFFSLLVMISSHGGKRMVTDLSQHSIVIDTSTQTRLSHTHITSATSAESSSSLSFSSPSPSESSPFLPAPNQANQREATNQDNNCSIQ